ncbi:uncharacterized protein [Halyomorpha halys]|uniref:uncharacterized protein n=1 Tax=Halyomorpha halys TaxID=286706 RepID=UPI0006D4EAD3|nr:uncharacterized protein LOC106681760 [Halyomorpha halys]
MGKGHHSCGVAVCRNTSVNARKRGLVIHFFRFPQDPDVNKEWIVKCSRGDRNFNPKNARVCSDHFTLNDYKDSLKAQLLGETPIRLKKNAVPTLLCTPLRTPLEHPSEPKKQYSHPMRPKCRKELKEISQLVDESSNQELLPISGAPSSSSHLNGKIKSFEEELSTFNRKLEENKESVLQEIESVVKENEVLKKRLPSKSDVFKKSRDRELERRVSQFIDSKVQIIVAELL